MAEVSLKVVLEGGGEATAGLNALAAAQQKVSEQVVKNAMNDEELHEIQQRLKAGGEELRKEVEARAAAQQQLKAHTDELVKKFQEQQEVEERAHSIGNQLIGMVGEKILRFTALTTIIGGTVAILHQMWSEGNASAEANTRLSAVMGITGGAVGKTTEALKEYAETLANNTRFTDEQYKQAMTVMLTFRDVQGEVFERAIKVAADYAELMGTDLVGAARLWGRALEDPAKGMEGMRRMNVILSESQKDLIKTLEKSGDLVGAQTVLIDAASQSYSGFAATVWGASENSLKSFTKNWTELLEEVGRPPKEGSVFSILLTTGAAWIEGIRKVVAEMRGEGGLTATVRLDRAVRDTMSSDPQDRARGEAYLRQLEEERIGIQNEIRIEQDLAEEARIGQVNERRMEQAAVAAKKQAEKDKKEREKHLKELANIQWQHDLKQLQELDRVDAEIERKNKEGTQQAKREADQQFSNWMKNTALIEAENERVAQTRARRAEKQLATAQQANEKEAESAVRAFRSVSLTLDEQGQALLQLRAYYEGLGQEGEKALQRIDRGIADLGVEIDKHNQAVWGIGATWAGVEAAVDQGIIDMRKGMATNLAEILKGHQSVGDGIVKIWGSITDAIINKFAQLVVDEGFNWVRKLMIGEGAATNWTQALFSSLSGLGSMLKDTLSGVVDWLGSALSGVVSGLASSIGSGIGSFFGGGGGGGGDEGGGMWSTIGAGIGSFFGPVGTVAGGFLGDLFGGFFATGGEQIVTRPTLFMAGEAGSERVNVTPMAGGRGGAGGVTMNFNGPFITDPYSMKLFLRGQERLLERGGFA